MDGCINHKVNLFKGACSLHMLIDKYTKKLFSMTYKYYIYEYCLMENKKKGKVGVPLFGCIKTWNDSVYPSSPQLFKPFSMFNLSGNREEPIRTECTT